MSGLRGLYRFIRLPGRTSALWDNFRYRIVTPKVWRENFRVSREFVYSLAEDTMMNVSAPLPYRF